MLFNHSLFMTGIVVSSLVLAGCPSDPDPNEDTEASTSQSPSSGATPSSGTMSSSDTASSADSSSSEGGSSEGTTTSGDATDGTTGDPPGLLDCEALCEPYADCDRTVYQSCQANCGEVVPLLAAADDRCGMVSATFFECFYGLSCEDAITAHTGELDPDPCEAQRAIYVDTCVAAASPMCDGYCDRLLECEGAELQYCAFECLGFHGIAVQLGEPTCDAAVDGYLTCYARNECVDLMAGACNPAADELTQACEL